MGRFMEIYSLYELVCVLLPCLLYAVFWSVKEWKAGRKVSGVYLGWVCIFLVYLWMVFDVTGVGTMGDIMRNMPDIFIGGMNFAPFDSLGIGFVLNIVMFMPFGFLLPLIFKDSRALGRTAAAGAVFSLLIELSQIFNFRATDVEDLMTTISMQWKLPRLQSSQELLQWQSTEELENNIIRVMQIGTLFVR